MLPIFQPGSTMFESAVKEGSSISIIKGGDLQNGPILRNKGALFLAKFICEIFISYKQLCQSNQIDYKGPVKSQIYKQALLNKLTTFCIEDMKEHGRLIALKERLVSLLGPEDKMDTKTLSLFQLNDFNCKDLDATATFGQQVDSINISSNDAVKAMDLRQRSMLFPNCKMF